MRSLRYYLKSVGRFLSFKPPLVNELNSIDIILEEKPLYLLSWTFDRRYKLKIVELNKTYYSASGSVVLKIPTDTASITMIVSTIWRKRKFIRQLNKIKLDDATAGTLIEMLNPMKMIPLNVQPPAVSKVIDHVLIPVVKHEIKPVEFSIELKPRKIDINLPLLIKKQFDYSPQSSSI